MPGANPPIQKTPEVTDETVKALILHYAMVDRVSYRSSDRIGMALGLRAIGIRDEDAVMAGPSLGRP
jgi:hypothetical protein